MGKLVGWIHFKSIAQLFDGSVVLASHVEAPSQTEVDADREWIEFSRFVDLCEALFRATHRHQIEGISLVSGCVAWVVLNRFGKTGGGATPVPIVVKLHGGERCFCFGKC